MVSLIFYVGLIVHLCVTAIGVFLSLDEEELHLYLGLSPLGFAGFAVLGYFIL